MTKNKKNLFVSSFIGGFRINIFLKAISILTIDQYFRFYMFGCLTILDGCKKK